LRRPASYPTWWDVNGADQPRQQLEVPAHLGQQLVHGRRGRRALPRRGAPSARHDLTEVSAGTGCDRPPGGFVDNADGARRGFHDGPVAAGWSPSHTSRASGSITSPRTGAAAQRLRALPSRRHRGGPGPAQRFVPVGGGGGGDVESLALRGRLAPPCAAHHAGARRLGDRQLGRHPYAVVAGQVALTASSENHDGRVRRRRRARVVLDESRRPGRHPSAHAT
jgi:hypothetical protein